MRLAAVGKLTDQTVLAEIAKNDNDFTVREAAVKNHNLTDQTVLAGIAQSDDYASVGSAAVGKLTDQTVLANIVKYCDDSVRRSVAVEKLTDQALLATIARNDSDYLVRKAAAGNPNLIDRTVLAEIAKNDKEVVTLTQELYLIGLSDGFLSRKPGGKFDDKCKNKRARQIGERLDKLGGIDLMREVHFKIEQMRGPARLLESCWGYIGRWLP